MTKTDDTKPLKLAKRDGMTDAAQLAEAAMRPAVNAAMVVDSFQDHVFGSSVEITELVGTLQASMTKSNAGDLSELENMLIGQATALQTMFVSLARRAQAQQYQKNVEAFLGLALKAQAQSRATIQAVIDLKFPRQATFVKQANIAQGPQQVNNGQRISSHNARALANQTEQNEVFEGLANGGSEMDTRATTAAARGNPAVETLATSHRPKKRGR
jgi:hypothetical protein